MALAMVFSVAACGGADAGADSAGSAGAESTSADGSDSAAAEDIYLTLVNKTHPLPENWEDNIELIEMKNAYDEDIRVEKTSYEAYLALRDALLKEGVDFELDNYKIDGETLKSVSGGRFPGVMHLKQDGPHHYAVTQFQDEGWDPVKL